MLTNNDERTFRATFRQLTGYEPLRWQTRLYVEWFSRGRIPSACDLPTGLGKTSIMAIWLIARASGANLPRRLVYVVDRRAVVDQATRFAETLRETAGQALGLDHLPISTLRGRFVDNREWLADPAALAIIVGTVDMIGSRLLFRGYGVSRRMRPLQAGLLGVDSLVLLDEAHLCAPFEALLRDVATEPDFAPLGEERRAVVPGFRLLPLSATGKEKGDAPFSLEGSDVDPEKDPVAFERFTAAKRLAIQVPAEGQKLEDALAERAWRYAEEEGPARVLVFCDRRETAVKVKQDLDKRLKAQKLTGASELLVGARRVHERQVLQNWLAEYGFLGGSKQRGDQPAFLVATSAGEVGVDLDADYMTCDLVAWERMVQRLGRVNRRGGLDRCADIDVIVGASKSEVDDPRRRACQELLRSLPTIDGRHDASPAALRRLYEHAGRDIELQQLLSSATSKPPLRPALTRALVEAWSLTTLDDHPGRPDVGPWLRGWVDDEPQITVAWRRWLPWRDESDVPLGDEAEKYLDLAPVHLEEVLEAPTYQVFEVLIDRARAVLKNVSQNNGEQDEARRLPGLISFDGTGKFRTALTIERLADLGNAPGSERKREIAAFSSQTILVAADLGGLNADGLLDKTAEQVFTLDEGWSEDERRRIGLCPLGPGAEDPDTRAWKLAGIIPLEDPESTRTNVGRAIRVFVLRQKGAARVGDQTIASRPQRLDEHHAWAAEAARDIAGRLGLPSRYAEVLVTATAHHDLGKQRVLWQVAMNAPSDGPYAKTTGGGNRRRLNGYRHEFGSLRDVLRTNAFAHLSDEASDLALQLVAAHHGFAHPTLPPFDPDATTSERERLARDVALRFSRLQRLWGPWGLAWWEALLRAADRCASKRLDEEDES